MRPGLFKLAAVLLVLCQFVLSASAGRSVCFDFGDCDHHPAPVAPLAPVAPAHSGSGGFNHSHNISEHCPCHVHVPMSGRLPAAPATTRGDLSDLKISFDSLLPAVLLCMHLRASPPAVLTPLSKPVALATLAQGIALRTTRLVI